MQLFDLITNNINFKVKRKIRRVEEKLKEDSDTQHNSFFFFFFYVGIEYRAVAPRAGGIDVHEGEMNKGGREVQTPRNKINNSWRGNVQYRRL